MHAVLQYLRWYVDGQFLYEINKQALVAQTNASGEGILTLQPAQIQHTYATG